MIGLAVGLHETNAPIFISASPSHVPLLSSSQAELKQRREVLDGTVLYVDAPPVRAALAGRLLLLDGVEKAERNVLPTLNNLLENREMGLPDGRFLVAVRCLFIRC